MKKIINRDNSLFQRDVAQLSSELVDNPILAGILVEDVVLSTTTLNVSHSLGRPFKGCIVVKKNANIDVWVDPASTVDTSLYVPLDASGAVTVSLWIF